MKRRIVVALLLLVAVGCVQLPITETVKIEFSKDDPTAVVTAETRFGSNPRTEESRKRIELARAAAQANTDAWASRFARLDAEEERVTYATRKGVLQEVIRSALISDDQIQQLFSESNVTVHVVHGDGWRELRIYPGTSSRATREQQRRFAEELESWSALVARYFTAVDRLYAHMNEHPGRARDLFAALMNEQDADGALPAVAEEEQGLVDDVEHAIDEVASRMNEEEGRAATFAEEADLVFNPFPARVEITLPSASHVQATEGFASEKTLTIEPIDLFAAIAGLEGTWISPDPLAVAVRQQQLTSEELARMPRKSSPFVPASAVTAAIREQLARPNAYVVRWQD